MKELWFRSVITVAFSYMIYLMTIFWWITPSPDFTLIFKTQSTLNYTIFMVVVYAIILGMTMAFAILSLEGNTYTARLMGNVVLGVFFAVVLGFLTVSYLFPVFSPEKVKYSLNTAYFISHILLLVVMAVATIAESRKFSRKKGLTSFQTVTLVSFIVLAPLGLNFLIFF